MNSKPIRLFSEAESLFQAVAEQVVRVIKATLTGRNLCHIALSGGSTPKQLYRLLATPDFARQIDWARVHFWFGDERCVKPDDVDSNYYLVATTLLAQVPIDAENVHRIEGELAPPRLAAEKYATQLATIIPSQPGSMPVFDLVLLGVGEDGHTASLFPGSAGLLVTDRAVTENTAPPPYTQRITLTLSVLNAARHVVFLVSGANKADIIQQIFQPEACREKFPAEQVQTAGEIVWCLDQAAASKIEV